MYRRDQIVREVCLQDRHMYPQRTAVGVQECRVRLPELAAPMLSCETP